MKRTMTWLASLAALLLGLAGCETATPPPSQVVALPPGSVSAKPGAIIRAEDLAVALAPVIAEHGGFGLHLSRVPAIGKSELPGVPRRNARFANEGRTWSKTFLFGGNGFGAFGLRERDQWKSAMTGTVTMDAAGRSIVLDSIQDHYITIFRRANGGLACLDHSPERPEGDKDHLEACVIIGPYPPDFPSAAP